MSGDHLAIAIDQNRNIEAKNLATFRNLLNLFFAMPPWVCRVQLKLGSRAEDDLQALLIHG